MLQNNEFYEKAFEVCEIEIKTFDEEIIKNDEEIKEKEEKNRNLNFLREKKIKLREHLLENLNQTVYESVTQSKKPVIEQLVNFPSETLESFFTVETPNGLVEISNTAFKGLDVIEAIIKFLRLVNHPQKTVEIVTALLSGGYETESAFFSELVRTALRKADKNSNSPITWRNKYWQLSDWFSKTPNLSKPIVTKKPSKRGFGEPKWGRSIGDVAEDILKNEKNGLHLEEIQRRLANEGLYPTFGSLDVAMRQDKKKRFKLVGKRIYGLTNQN